MKFSARIGVKEKIYVLVVGHFPLADSYCECEHDEAICAFDKESGQTLLRYNEDRGVPIVRPHSKQNEYKSRFHSRKEYWPLIENDRQFHSQRAEQSLRRQYRWVYVMI